MQITWIEIASEITRIGFGFMFFMKLAVSFHAHRLLWAHHRPKGFSFLAGALLICVFLITIGFLTWPAAIAAYFIYLYLFRSASLYGMDDNISTVILIYLILAAPGKVFSIDYILGISFDRPLGFNFFPEWILAIQYGLILFSASIKKMQSPIWKSGNGVYAFFLLPLHRRFNVPFLDKLKYPLRFMNFFMIALQCFYLTSVLARSQWTSVGMALLVLCFGISLSTLFNFTWLGELICIGLIPQIILFYFDFPIGRIQHTPLAISLLFVILFSTIAVGWSGVVSHLYPEFSEVWNRRMHLFYRAVARWSWGFLPVDLFGERHLKSPVVYRVFLEEKNSSKEVFKIFSEKAMAGPARNWKPTFIEVTQYKVAEACMEIDLYGKIKTEAREQFIIRLAEYAAKSGSVSALNYSVKFQISQILLPECFDRLAVLPITPWKEAFEVVFSDANKPQIKIRSKKLLQVETGRKLERVSFEFHQGAL